MAVKLKFIREKSELTQRQVAKLLNVSKTNYNYFENEERFIPLKHLNSFCNYFNVSMDYVFSLNNTNIVSKNIENLDKKLIGQRIKYIRKIKKLTQKELAKILNTSQSTISSYESGKTLIITAFLYELCKRLNVSMDYITTRSNIIKIIDSNE